MEKDIFWDEIISIEYAGEEHVYDIEAEGTYNFIANDIVAHNTYLKGNVGIGAGAPAHKLEVAGSMNVSNDLNVSGLCVTGDTLLSMADGGKKKIVDVNADEYDLPSNEETEKIGPHRIIGLLDMGIKPIFNLTARDGRSINTTGNHPYLTPNGWIKVAELKEGHYIAVPIRNYSISNNFLIPSVEKISTSDCSLNLFSLDQMAQSEANAKYEASFGCPGSNLSALDKKSLYSDFGTTLSISVNSMNDVVNSSSSILQYLQTLSLSDKSSSNSKSGINSLILFIYNDSRRFLVKESGLKNENTMQELTTNSILSNYIRPCLLATLSFNSSASSAAFSSVNLLFFNMPSTALNNNNTLSFSSTASLNNGCAFLSSSPAISAILSGISTFTSAILTSPIENNENGYLNVMEKDILWNKIISIEYAGEEHVYDIEVEGTHNFIANDIIAPSSLNSVLPDISSEKNLSLNINQPLPSQFFSSIMQSCLNVFLGQGRVCFKDFFKINKVSKEPYSGRIYDLTVPNHIILVKRENLVVYSGNCYHNLTSLADEGCMILDEKMDKIEEVNKK